MRSARLLKPIFERPAGLESCLEKDQQAGRRKGSGKALASSPSMIHHGRPENFSKRRRDDSAVRHESDGYLFISLNLKSASQLPCSV